MEAYLRTGERLDDPTIEERVEAIREHARLQVLHYTERGLVKLRKHLPWYFKGFHGWKELRTQLVRINNLAELDAILEEVLERSRETVIA